MPGVVEKDTTIVSGFVDEAKDRVQTKLDGRTEETDTKLICPGYLLSGLWRPQPNLARPNQIKTKL